ncbi:hypothetical protein FOC1_g10007616 [Fusarium oxysporum f. sp. cubense race 1]|uniref:Uncharacterized protein n=1 Tax=Fusarium oxysporum f. sp. cubense (strain race 1) TaxID=1229664 RepID=N4URF8_FUSC1|nr:hypothetical protein FOC1_g10007616 [Fusarium oxysporum f. sp. cubense race 1]
MVSLRLTSLERRVDKASARLRALEHSQPISPQKDSSRRWSLEHLLCKPRLMNTPTIGFLRIGEAEGSFVTSLRVSLPVETQNLPEDKDRIMGLHQEVECMNHLQTRVRKGEGHRPLVTEGPLQIPLMPPREVVAYRERKGQYYQVPHANAYQNTVPRRMSTPPIGANTMSSSSTYPASYALQPSGPRGRDPSPLRTGHYGTSQGRDLTPPRGARGRR